MIDPETAARLDAVVEFILRIAEGELSTWVEPTGDGDQIDATLVGLNMLAEELRAAREGRRRAEALLQDEVDAYDRAPAMFATVDGTTATVLKCNRTLADALGRPKLALVGHSVTDFHAPESHRVLAELLDGSRPYGRSRSAEVEILTAEGTRITDLTALRVADGDGDRWRLIWRDVTTERALAHQLRQAQKLEAIGRLSAGVAHDFNNLLAVVVGSASMLREEAAARLQPDELGDVETILAAAKRGTALTEGLLAFSRQRPGSPRPTDVREVVAESQRLIQRLLPAGIVLDVQLDDEPQMAVIDPSRLSQVVLNLAINARDAMPGGGRLTMGVRRETVASPGEPGTQSVVISVADEGAGMSRDVIEHAFDPFFTTKDVGRGTGLGLSTSYGIVQQAGGTIDIHSELGVGTTVRVILPA